MSQKGQKVQIHPLVIMQMSEHYSRFKVQLGRGVNEVYGAILGRQNNRQVEAINSFQLKVGYSDDGVDIDSFGERHTAQRAEQYLEVFPELQIIGIYCCSENDNLTGNEKSMLLKLALAMRGVEKTTHIDSPLLLKMNAVKAGIARTLPLTAFEVDMVDIDRISKLEWILVSEESERIGVNHIAKLSTKDGVKDGGADEKHAKAQMAAMQMLSNRVEMILAYFERVKNGEKEADWEILKEANLLTQRLKTIDRYGEEMGEDFAKEEKTIALFQLMPQITKLVGNMAHVWAKVARSRQITESLSDEGFHLRQQTASRWSHQFGQMRNSSENPPPGIRRFTPVRNNEDEDYLDEEDENGENGGLKRKINMAENNMSGNVGNSNLAKQPSRKERKGRRQEKCPRALATSSSASSSANNNPTNSQNDQEMMEPGWNSSENVRTAGNVGSHVPDAPMPSASNSAPPDQI
ncbi:unnamed protein product [Caenorhabditis angaria]|uniref:COP9 signalosome complex subunit 6 n=1 Tax=Caenorhabditis angaria TaxID=860376 RepID=A0A9P1IMK1_9PELO|nr:unnamed protein product [Caenorhabditis angaria]